MKKSIVFGLLFIFILAGCAKQSGGEENKDSAIIAGKDGGRLIDFEKPEERPDVSGIVKTIVGNEVTILKINRPGESGDKSGDGIETGTKEASSRFGSGAMGMGGRMKMLSGDDEVLEALKRMSSGEEKIIIPVGIKMLKNDGEEIVEANLSDIKKDSILTVWNNKDISDRNVAVFVLIK